MQDAWLDRDVRQRTQDALVKDLMQRETQAQLFTNLANGRIADLKSELVSLCTSVCIVHLVQPGSLV